MSEAMRIEERLRRCAAVPTDADWEDVLRRASLPPRAGRLHRLRWTRRRLVVAVVVVAIALALPTLALSGVLGSILGISNHGKRVYPGTFAIRELRGPVRLFKSVGWGPPDSARPDTFARMAQRQGIGVYVALSKKNNSLCFFRGQRHSFPGFGRNRLYLDGPGCNLPSANFGSGGTGTHLFPSRAHPVLDLSYIGEGQTRWPKGASPKPTPLSVPHWPKGSGRTGPILPNAGIHRASGVQPWRQWEKWINPPPADWPSMGPLIGVATDRVHSMQVLALSDCHVVATVRVIDNVYIDAHLPPVADLFLVARDAQGKVVWHSPRSSMAPPFTRTPLERSAPRNCGLG